ncbi:MAG: hypothetical protein HYY84_08480 [Deltaproteobacteria bacterium]|nr:hypothetical protein [Deltaproteobacteria bacterium]
MATIDFDAASPVSRDIDSGVSIDAAPSTDASGDSADASLDAMDAAAPAPSNDLWQGTLQMGTLYEERVAGVALDPSGNLYVAGETGDVLGNAGGNRTDGFLAKVSASGAVIWLRQFGTPRADSVGGVAQSGDDGVVVVGSTDGVMDGVEAVGGTDIFLMRFDADGGRRWTRQFGTPWFDWGADVAVDARGDLYVTGGIDGGTSGREGIETDAFVARLDADGGWIWMRAFGAAGRDVGGRIALDAMGAVVVLGSLSRAVTESPQSADGGVFVAWLGANGTLGWLRQFNASQIQSGKGLAVDRAGGIHVAGITYGNLRPAADGADICYLKLDRDGGAGRAFRIVNDRLDFAEDVAVDSRGAVYLTGGTRGGLGNYFSAGATDVFLLKLVDDENDWFQNGWLRQLGTTAGESGSRVVTGPGGAVFVAGVTGGVLGRQAYGSWDVFVAKYDADGGLH